MKRTGPRTGPRTGGRMTDTVATGVGFLSSQFSIYMGTDDEDGKKREDQS